MRESGLSMREFTMKSGVSCIMNEEERIKARHKTLGDFWREKASKGYRSVRLGGPCEWCDRFKPLDFRVCMNCGALLGGKGAFS